MLGLILITINSGYAQFSINIMAGLYGPGLTYSSYENRLDLDNTLTMNIAYEKEIGNHFLLETGMTYFSIIMKEHFYFWADEWIQTWHLYHLQVPLLLKYRIIRRSPFNFNIYIGNSIEKIFNITWEVETLEGSNFSWDEDFDDGRFYVNAEAGSDMEIKITSKLYISGRIGIFIPIPFNFAIRTRFIRGDTDQYLPLKKTISFQYLLGMKINL